MRKLIPHILPSLASIRLSYHPLVSNHLSTSPSYTYTANPPAFLVNMPIEGRRLSSNFLMMKMTEKPVTRLVRSLSPKSFSHHRSHDSGFSQSIDFKDTTIRSSSSSCLSSEDRSFSTCSLNRSAGMVPSTNVNQTINAVISRQPSVLNMEIERQKFGHDLEVLEPRPIVYWGSFEETLGNL